MGEEEEEEEGEEPALTPVQEHNISISDRLVSKVRTGPGDNTCKNAEFNLFYVKSGIYILCKILWPVWRGMAAGGKMKI